MSIPEAAYSSFTTYAKGDTVTYKAVVYTSLVADNLSNVPGVSPAYWSVSPWSKPVPPTEPPVYVGPPVASHAPVTASEAVLLDIVNLKRDVAALKAEHVGIWRALGGATRIL